jgi:CheY-like chemotaxis protein
MRRALVVDDDDDIRDLIAHTLDKQGYDVASFVDPVAALASAAETGFDVALLDWSMPVMDGGELCARLRELPGLRDVPIVIVTAHADQATRDRAVAAGATRFLAKPFSLKNLAEVVAELLGPGA